VKQLEASRLAQRVTKRGASTSGRVFPLKCAAIGVCSWEVQRSLEPAEPWCRAVQAAGSLNSGLA
jgi:hypothetical protein